MVDVWRVNASWQGFQGAPGYSKFSFFALTDISKINAAGAAIRTFFDAIKVQLVPGCTIQVAATVPVHDMATGLLIREDVMTTPPALVTSTASPATPYNGGVGAYVTWNTGGIFNGHRVRGRTYLVPLCSTDSTDGTLSTGTASLLQTAANALVSSQTGVFCVWSRQWTDSSPPTQIGGATSSVISASIPDKTGILRSRRD